MKEEPEIVFRLERVPDKRVEMFAMDADLTVYWPWVRPCWEETGSDIMAGGMTEAQERADGRARWSTTMSASS